MKPLGKLTLREIVADQIEITESSAGYEAKLPIVKSHRRIAWRSSQYADSVYDVGLFVNDSESSGSGYYYKKRGDTWVKVLGFKDERGVAPEKLKRKSVEAQVFDILLEKPTKQPNPIYGLFSGMQPPSIDFPIYFTSVKKFMD